MPAPEGSGVVARGGCLCGAVRYEARAPLRDVIACHCSQCRRTSGHHVAATQVASADLHFVRDAGLKWYRSSGSAERGFCKECGGNLFWRPLPQVPGAHTSIMAGTLDAPTGLRIARHIYVADKSDYYGISDGVRQSAQWD